MTKQAINFDIVDLRKWGLHKDNNTLTYGPASIVTPTYFTINNMPKLNVFGHDIVYKYTQFS